MNGIWSAYRRIPLIWKIAIGFALGVVAGLIFGPSISVIKPFGTLFIRMLSMLVMPLILFTLIAGAASVSPQNLGRVGGKIFVYYMLTSAFAVAAGLAVASLVNPGRGLSLGSAEFTPTTPPPLSEVLLNMVPNNVFNSLTNGQPLPVIFFALLFGITISILKASEGRKAELAGKVLDVVEGINEAMFQMVQIVMQYAPIGVFALIADVVGSQGLDVMLPLGKMISVMYVGSLIQVGVYVMLMTIFRVPVARFFSAHKDAIVTAFVTRSSNGTLPISMECSAKFGVDRSIFGFSLPLGATINMDGAAVYMGAAVIFAANVVGVDLTFSQMLAVVITGTLASVGSAGVPGAALIMVTMVLTQTGLPLAVIGMIAGIDAILDMARTCLNVMGDLCGTAIVAKTEKQLNLEGTPAAD